MVKVKVPLAAPRMFSPVVTVTVSPGVNRAAGRKLAPWPSEWARSVPACAPLVDPVTVIRFCRSLRDAPRKLICVFGFAMGVPSAGNTATAPGGALWEVPAPAAAAISVPQARQMSKSERRRCDTDRPFPFVVVP